MRRSLLFAWWSICPPLRVRLARRAFRNFGNHPLFMLTYLRQLGMTPAERAFIGWDETPQ